MKRAVFLDRDGVLNKPIVRDGRAYAPLALDDFRLVTEAPRQVARLRDAGLLCIVVTNQPEVARGTLGREMLEEMHRRLLRAVPMDDLYVCLHDPADGCECHKPRAGMLRSAAAKWAIGLEQSFVIGDRRRDIEAGRAVGCYTILLERSYSDCAMADARADSLAGAVDLVLARVASA